MNQFDEDANGEYVQQLGDRFAEVALAEKERKEQLYRNARKHESSQCAKIRDLQNRIDRIREMQQKFKSEVESEESEGESDMASEREC